MIKAPLTLDADAVAALLPRIDMLEELRNLFSELGEGAAVQPAQSLTLLPEGQGDFITYLGALSGAGVFGAKLSPYLIQESKPIITAWTLLMSLETGKPLMLCDAGQLTTERTAATTALAVDYLAKAEAKRLAIIGSGPVAQAHLRHVQQVREWQDIALFSPNLASNPDTQAIWKGLSSDVRFAQSAAEAADGADAVLLCTSSGTPVLDWKIVAPGALVTSISTNHAKAHEVAPEFLSQAQVYCDYRATTPASAGEMVLAANAGNWSAEEIKGDLAELACESCSRPEGPAPVFFRSIGLGLEDIAAANAIYHCSTSE